jgi:hypothetical protein
MMHRNSTLVILTVISIILESLHLTHDVVRGMDKASLVAVLILIVWLTGPLLLAEKRSGYVIMLLGAIFAMAMPVLHLTGKGVNAEFIKTSAGFFFLWTLYAIGTTGALSGVIAVRELWLQRKAR